MPFVTRSITSSFDGFVSSRFGPTFPVASAAASVWQLPQPASAKIALPSASPPPSCHRLLTAGLGSRRCANGEPGHRGDVGGDRLRVVAGDDVRRHARQPRRRLLDGIRDLAADDGVDRRLAEPVRARLAERVVQVRADHALRTGVGQRVALAALLLEELLAAGRVAAAGLRQARGAATGRGQSRDQCRDQGRACTCQPAQLHSRPRTPSSATRKRRRLPASRGS